MVNDYLAERSAVLEIAQRLLARGLTVGSSGNVSCRVGENLLAITPNRRYTEDVTPALVPVVTFDGESVTGDAIPSSELLMHAAVYQARDEVQAVIHCHPPYTGVLAVSGQAIPPILEDQMIYLGGQIEVAPHAMSGSEELAGYAVAALGERNACILANHGALAVGRDLRAALYACEYLEKLALAYVFATLLGKVNLLSPEVVETERAFFQMLRMA